MRDELGKGVLGVGSDLGILGTSEGPLWAVTARVMEQQIQTPPEEFAHIGLGATVGSREGYWLMDLFHRCFLLSYSPRFYGDIAKECNISIDLTNFIV